MCNQQTTEICDNLAAQANEAVMAEQREATIAAALALPEADRYRLWRLLDEQFSPHSEGNAKRLEAKVIMLEKWYEQLVQKHDELIEEYDDLKYPAKVLA